VYALLIRESYHELMENDEKLNPIAHAHNARALTTKLQELGEEAREIIAAGVPKNTRRTYNAQWRKFHLWCAEHDRCALPTEAETLILYLTARSHEVKVTTLNVALAAITVAHREAGYADWAATDLQGVRVFMRGLRRTKSTAPEKKAALFLSDIAKGLPSAITPEHAQTRALILVGFFAALRRSELVGLNVTDVEKIPNGYRLMIWHSKTDKTDEGQVVSIPKTGGLLCPSAALGAWIEQRDVGIEALFTSRGGGRMTVDTVAFRVKAVARRAGLDPAQYAGHSLRSGFVTEAARHSAGEHEIMKITRHRSERTVRGYIQEGTLGDNHPGLLIAAAFEEKE
jgi:integrase